MRMRRLGWAGIELEADDDRLVIDPLVDPGIFSAFLGPEAEPRVAPEPGVARAALLTHLHRDHADVGALDAAVTPGGEVLRPEAASATEFDEFVTGEAERGLAETGRPQVLARAGDARRIGAFEVTALPAVDGLGSPQVSWLVEAGGRRVLHGGDTLWHGGWWAIAAAAGPIHVACLPANGVEIDYPNLQPAADGVPAVMTPEQSVQAARALRADVLVPMHDVRMFEHETYYRPVTGARQRLTEAGAAAGVAVRITAPGDWIEV